MRTITNEELLEMLKKEIEKNGLYVYGDRRRTIQEMLRMRNVKF
jgi:transposase-like protein